VSSGDPRFCDRFEAEARAAGGELDARRVMGLLTGEVRPSMVETVRRCHERLKTGLLTNNFVADDQGADHSAILANFDVIVESSVTDPDDALAELEAIVGFPLR
jgi:putative hydrolase of the HAD superfamily